MRVSQIFKISRSYPRMATNVENSVVADFEGAITATGFGKFNILLVLAMVPPAFGQVFETAALSYVIPIAQCDLDLSLEDKGLLNAMTFAGMLTSSFFWGYLSDMTGRKRIMVIGYFLSGFICLVAFLSQTSTMLIITKFFGGLIYTGPYSTTTSYLSEFHASKFRARVQLTRGIIITLGTMVLPLLAWAVLPRNLHFVLFGRFDIFSWNIFLFIGTWSSIASGVIFLFMPESPKFLMTDGRNEEAMKVFKKIYRSNTGNSAESYPVKELVHENIQNGINTREHAIKGSVKGAIKEGFYQMKPLFLPPHIIKLLHVSLNACLMLMSYFSLQLWIPQLFQSINDYKFTHNGSSSSICEMIEDLRPRNTSICIVNLENSEVYINSVIIAAPTVLAYVVAGLFVNMIGKKRLTIIMAFISGCCAICIYFAQNSETLLVLSGICLSFTVVSSIIIVAITLELFPTNLRAMALSLHLMSARLGSILGNILFPILLNAGCAPPFIFTGSLAIASACLSFLYRNTDNKALQ